MDGATSTGSAVKNKDLWVRIDALVEKNESRRMDVGQSS